MGPRVTYDIDNSDDSWNEGMDFDDYEYHGIKCVLATVRHFLGCTDESFVIFTPFSSQKDYPKFQFQKGPFSTIRKRFRKKRVSISWKLEEPKRLADDSEIREDFAVYYFLEHCGARFQSWFGICIWDYTRLTRFKSSLWRCEWAADWEYYIY